jgi:hypothetical protein
MYSPEEYRRVAQEFAQRAEQTADPEHRETLLRLAREFMRATLEVERSLALRDDD